MATGTDYLAQAPQQPKPQTPYAFTQAPPAANTAPKSPTITPKAPTVPPVPTGPGGAATQAPQATPQVTPPAFTRPSLSTDNGWGPEGPSGGGEQPNIPPPPPPVVQPPDLPPGPPVITPPLLPPDTGGDKIDFDPFNSDKLKAAFDFYSGRLKEQANIATSSADANAASRGLYYSTVPEMAKTGIGGIQENLQNGLGQLSSSLLIPEAQMTMEAQNNYVQQALQAAALADKGNPDLSNLISALRPNPNGNTTDPYSNIGNWLAKL